MTRPAQTIGMSSGITQLSAGHYHVLAEVERDRAGLAVARPALITVPGLSSDTTAQAGQVLQAAGLVLGAVHTAVGHSCNNIGTVMSQNPAAGTAVSFGSAISITLGQRPPSPCP